MTYEFDDVKYSKYNKPSRTTQFVAILRNRRYLVTFAIATIVLVWYLQPFQSGSQQLSTQQQQQQLQNNKDPLKDYRPPPPVLDNRPDQEQVPLVPPPPLPLPPPPPPPASISEQQQEDSSYFLFTQHPPPQKLQPDDAETAIRQKRIVEAFQHAWRGYAADAFGMDEYQPLSQTGRNWAPGGIGLMIVDALDTMLLMNLTEEYNQAREWVATRLDFDKQQDVNVFETTIRVLGGLLSAYHLSGEDPVYLEKAQDLGNRLVGAFNTESGIPYPSVTLSTGLPFKFHSTSSTAEATTIQLEFKYLSHLTGDYKYWDVAERVMHKMKQLVDDGETVDGLVPILMNPVTGLFVTQEIRLGSRGDSYYEYLIKQYLQTDKTEPLYRDMYDHSVQGIRKHLLARSFPNNLLYIGEIQHSRPDLLNPKMDHLVCFIGGTFALGATQGLKLADSPIMTQSHLDDLGMGRDITRTCYEMYNTTATGLASEIVYFSTKPDSQSDILIKPLDRHNLLRPETMESLFVLWRITGDPIYREWGWRIFEAFEKHTKLPVGGYAALKDVTRVPAPKEDRMDTFFLAETLKYLYLLFSPDDIIPLDNYVFNSEAHPLPIFRPNRQLKM